MNPLRQVGVSNLPRVVTQLRPDRESNPGPCGLKSDALPLRHHATPFQGAKTESLQWAYGFFSKANLRDALRKIRKMGASLIGRSYFWQDPQLFQGQKKTKILQRRQCVSLLCFPTSQKSANADRGNCCMSRPIYVARVVLTNERLGFWVIGLTSLWWKIMETAIGLLVVMMMYA